MGNNFQGLTDNKEEGTQLFSPSHRRQNCPWNIWGLREEQDPQTAKTIDTLTSDCSGGLSYQQRGTWRCTMSLLSGSSHVEGIERYSLSGFALTPSRSTKT